MPSKPRSRYARVLIVYRQAAHATKRTPMKAIRAHLRTLDHLYSLLQDWQVPFRAIPLEQLGPIARAKLVITVGGDGTVLSTSHYVTTQPIFGIKSFGETSVGHFCAATTDNFHEDLKLVLGGDHRPRELNRLTAKIGSHHLQESILNDILFAHGSPAAITDYRLTIGKVSEVQRSSGLWISTAAGSTAAICSAGGRHLPLASKRIQYHVREPWAPLKAYRLLGGVLPAQTVLKITSHAQHGTLSIDGAHIQYPVPEGTTITVRQAKQPLKIYWR
jgi:NAD+ kinase